MNSGESTIQLDTLRVSNLKLLNGLWYIVELSPLPNNEEVEKVIECIINDRELYVDDNFDVHPYKNINSIHLKKKVLRVIRNLKQQQFRIGVRKPNINYRDGSYDFNGLPVSIVLSEIINFDSYPFHPHLNHVVPGKIPATICYIENPKLLGNNLNDIVINAIEQISIWLIRHLFMVEYYKLYNEVYWIGAQAQPAPEFSYINSLNPKELCRCGSKKIYLRCCFGKHLFKTYRKVPSRAIEKYFINQWEETMLLESKIIKTLSI